jgi:hypothetical protein
MLFWLLIGAHPPAPQALVRTTRPDSPSGRVTHCVLLRLSYELSSASSVLNVLNVLNRNLTF